MEFEEALKMVDTAVFTTAARHLQDAEVTVLRGAWQGMTYDQMAETSQYKVNYLMRDVGPKLWKVMSEALGEEVSKTNFRAALERRSRRTQEQRSASILPAGTQENSQFPILNWNDAPDVSVFYGRSEELATLQKWILQDNCRLVALLGLGGIGKTTLSVKLAKEIQNYFDAVIWRSLRQAPPINEFLANLIQFLNGTTPSENIDTLLGQLIAALQTSRCLVVLDNFETILQSGELAGQYREGYKWYGELLRRVGEEPHKSCVILTSQEKPREIVQLAGKSLPVRALTLKGLQEEDAREILKAKGLSGEEKWKNLIEFYRGNPLALKLITTTIEELFNRNVASFFKGRMRVFGDIQDLLYQPFNRLSELEKELMYWLAIAGQPSSQNALLADIWLPVSQRDLFEALNSLARRSLIEPSSDGESLFSLQPVVMEYVINQFIEEVSDEICELLKTKTIENTKLFRSHSLVTSAKDNKLLTAVVDRLRTIFRSEQKIVQPLTEVLQLLPEKSQLEVGYVSKNILHLLEELNSNRVPNNELLHQPLVPRAPES